MRTLTCAELALTPDRSRARVAGLVITRQRPGTASGVIFVTLEDETGVANVIVWPKTYESFRRAVISGRLLRVTGQLQREGSVAHLVARQVEDLSHLLDGLGRPRPPVRDGDASLVPGRRRPGPDHPREQAKRIFPSRDFH